MPENLYLDRPDSGPVPLPIGSGNGVEDLAWSPDGQQIAFDDAEFASPATPTGPATPAAGQLGVIPAVGGSADIVYRLPGSDIRLAAWWPHGGGLLFWEAPGFAEAADGATLYSLGSGSTSPVPLVPSLVGPIWVVAEPEGDAVAVVAGTGRSIWSTGRDVALCTFPSAQCRSVNEASGTESLAPSWTASGALLFSEASTSAPFGSEGDAVLELWIPGAVERHQHRMGAHHRGGGGQSGWRAIWHRIGGAGHRWEARSCMWLTTSSGWPTRRRRHLRSWPRVHSIRT